MARVFRNFLGEMPDQTFYNSRTMKFVDRRFYTISNPSVFSKVLQCYVGQEDNSLHLCSDVYCLEQDRFKTGLQTKSIS